VNMREVRKLTAGDTLRHPSKNGHDVTGFRRYEITAVDEKGISLTDEHGYSCIMRFADGFAKVWLKDAEPIKVQQ
jgi:hypothetical protein